MFTPALLKEAHALLWTDPVMNRGVFDVGMNCRDHALAFAALFKANGIEAAIATGKNMIVWGPRNGRAPIGLGQEQDFGVGHSWVITEAGDLYDYSLKLPDARRDARFKGLTAPIVERGQCSNVPNARVLLTRLADEFTNEVNAATHVPDQILVAYLVTRIEAFTPQLLANPLSWLDSPLSNRIASRYAPDIYAKLVMHLIEFSRGESRSLTGKSQIGAWNTIARRGDDDLPRYLQLTQATRPITATPDTTPAE